MLIAPMMASCSTGIFEDTVGLSYRSGELAGQTSSDGRFQYIEGQDVIFSIGPLELGRAKGKPKLTVLDLVENPTLTNPRLLNRARLLWSFTPALGFEKFIKINEQVRTIVSKYASEINLNATDTTELDNIFQKIGQEVGVNIKTIPHVRNHIRRALAGFKVLRDIRIPVRDGNFMFADIYLPLGNKFPVLVSSTVYGKRSVYSGPRTDDPNDVAIFEKNEDYFFSTSDNMPIDVPYSGAYFANWTKQRDYENISHFNTFFWVPRGYVMVKIDPRGVVQSPGKRRPFLLGQEEEDIYDAVEWAASQNWSSGNVALVGNSYGANCQWRPASKKPKGLKAFIPYGTEVDNYRDLSFIGGVSMFKFLSIWYEGLSGVSPRWGNSDSFVDVFSSHPFYDNFWKKNEIDLDALDLPVFLGAAQLLMYHQRGPFEAWRTMPSKHKYIQLVDTNYYSWPNVEAVNKLYLFLERFLKGIDRGELEPVGLQMRIGHGDWYWRTESDWEIPGTEYIDWHLQLDGSLGQEAPATGGEAKTFSYPAEVEPKTAKAGVTFTSKPFEKDVELAGHFAATLNVSSTSHDADLVVSLWVIDENGKVVRYCEGPNNDPFGTGLLRASHRKLDPEKSLPWRPFHTHAEADYAPLENGKAVEVNVEIWPVTARIRAGWRLRVDILPSDQQPDIPGFKPTSMRAWDETYHEGAVNTVHVGGQYKNFIKVPVVPLKNGPLNVVP